MALTVFQSQDAPSLTLVVEDDEPPIITSRHMYEDKKVGHAISIVNTPGTIDAGYRGEVCVIAINLGSEPYTIEKDAKIAQLVFNRVENAAFKVVESLPRTQRYG